MGTLYECLREARLEKFYPAFRANGITRSEALINLGMPEFCALGITGSEDKRRLIELVNIIKSVHNSGLSHSVSVSRRNVLPRSQPSEIQEPGRNLSQGRSALENSGLERVPNFSAASYADMLQYLTESSESESSDEQSEEEEPPEQVNVRTSPSVVRSSLARGPVERIQHSKAKGYNYGVHKVSSTPKARSSRSASAAQRSNSGDDKIRVCVRKRCLSRKESKSKDEDIVSVESTNTLIVNEPKLAVDLKAYTLQHEFIFDEVFNESCSNQDVYLRAARPLISCIFNGGTATCFAYGQTGAGKTYTMLGNPEVPGLYLLAGEDIFSIIHSGQYGRDLHVWVSYFEIYCGQLFDLLNRRNRLYAREDGNKQVCITGLTETEATSVQSLVQIMDYGNSVRSKGATGVNPDSSRSHAILQLDIRDNQDAKLGKMSFIDLAGSERGADVTDSDRQTRFEGAEINQSLLALKECIRSIDQESRHTPFRQSKLTHILKDSFVGNSRTCMIANISPAQSASENTLNTLRYADRVKELKRDSVRSSTVGRAMNLLMNIPPNAPSIFHPSNILSTSTPNRRGPASRTQRSNAQNEIVLDPSETPIRGHNLPRRHTSTGAKHKTGQSQVEESQSHQEQLPFNTEHKSAKVPRGSSSRSSSLATAASQGASVPPPDASPSESDQTDTDSCNITNPTKLNARGLTERLIPVAKSSDTEFDFPTSDFNNLDEINDLNRPNPNPKEDATSHKNSPREREPDSAVGSASAAAAASGTAVHTDESFFRRAPIVKPVVYKSTDLEQPKDPPTSKNSNMKSEKSDISTIASPKISQLPPTFMKKPSFYDVLSSDSMDEEEMLAEGSSKDSKSPDSNNLAQEASKVGGISVSLGARNLVKNKDLMTPLPANSSDLTKFTQRPSLMLSDHSPKSQMNNLSNKNRNKNDPSPLAEPSPNSGIGARLKAAGIKENTTSDPPLLTTELQNNQQSTPPSVDQQNNSHVSSSPMSDNTYHSPKSLPHVEFSESRRRRRASQSPTGEVSDDSTDSIRASLSDQGPAKNQPGSGEVKSGMRKERSDPMLALSMQRKKHTLPDPQNISKKLTRGSSHKVGLFQNLSGMKVVHAEVEIPQADSTASPSGDYPSHPDSLGPVSSESQSGQSDASTVISKDQRVLSSSPVGSKTHEISPKEIPSKPMEIIIHKLDGSRQFLQTQTTGISNKPETTLKNQGVIITEKLASGAVFSPIHPQPVTSAATFKNARELSLSSGIASALSSQSTLLQPTPVTASTMSWIGSSVDSSVQEGLSQATIDARLHLISAHEDQLASITSLCKYEMRLLLNAKKATGRRGFDDYLKKVNDILHQKMTSISTLQEEIFQYRNSCQGGSRVSSVSASAINPVSRAIPGNPDLNEPSKRKD